MLQGLKLARLQPHPLFLSTSPSSVRRKTAITLTQHRFVQERATRTDSSPMDKMDNNSKSSEKNGDAMSHSFGEGYATRSSEEGFGGIYSDNQTPKKTEGDKDVHENHPNYDKSQGSEVKEKEKGRNTTQENASS